MTGDDRRHIGPRLLSAHARGGRSRDPLDSPKELWDWIDRHGIDGVIRDTAAYLRGSDCPEARDIQRMLEALRAVIQEHARTLGADILPLAHDPAGEPDALQTHPGWPIEDVFPDWEDIEDPDFLIGED